jgi:uncharacterized protein (TIGR02271 family)
MLGTQHIERLEGLEVIDQDGDKIGTVDDIYVDDRSGAPEFAAVKSGLFGTKRRFVPIRIAEEIEDSLRVPYTKAQVSDAPTPETDGHLSEAEEAQLYRHYHLGESRAAGTPGARERTGRDDAMTRSEEELHVGTRTREAGRVRLRKWVETENVTTTVPVKKEKARIEREPVTGANRDRAMRGSDISESEHEVTLTEEEPVVQKRTVPKERVRLEKETDTAEEAVSGDVRKERIDVEGPARDDR